MTPPAGPAVPTSGARRGGRALDYPSSARDVIREVLTGTGLSTTQAVQVLADAAPETFGSLRPSEVLDLTGADLALAVEILRAATDPTSPTYGGGEGP